MRFRARTRRKPATLGELTVPSTELVQLELDEPARVYVMREMDSGGSFARILRPSLPLSSGRLFGYFPAGNRFSEPDDFTTSPLLTKGIQLGAEAQRRTQELVLQSLARDRRCCFLLETSRLSSDSPSPHPHFLCRDEVYLFMTGEDPVASALNKLLHSGRHYPFIAAVATIPQPSASPVCGSTVEDDVLHLLGQNTDFLFVGACDAEGYNVIWSRDT
jgi:hypothetical protein